MKTAIFSCVAALACLADAATVESVSISQMWPVSTDVKVNYVLSGVSEPVDVSVAVLDIAPQVERRIVAADDVDTVAFRLDDE